MSKLENWNMLEPAAAAQAVLPCCGSERWAAALAARRPLRDESALLDASDEVWHTLTPEDWQEAFRSHPRIGERKPQAAAAAQSLAWSTAEQAQAMLADNQQKTALREANRRYEERFGRIFLICANGRSTSVILAELERRLENSPEAEWEEAGSEQARITVLRLRRWLQSEAP